MSSRGKTNAIGPATLRRAVWFSVFALALACRPPKAPEEPRAPEAPPALDRPAADARGATFSPQPDAEEHTLARLCSRSDAALARVARETAQGLRDGTAAPDPAEVSLALRFHGAPYVWPRLWVLTGPRGDAEGVRARMQRWLASFGDGGERRCGVASVPNGEGSALVVAVAVDAVADLEPLPRRLEVGSWVNVAAQVLVPSSGAKIVVSGPRGAPRTLPTSFQGERASARFHADAPGEWWVQVLASTSGGPRPVLEALIHVGVEPERAASSPSPGEAAARPGDDPETALARMVAGARAEHGLAPLARDPELDAIAEAHAEHMRAAGRVAHDLGSGDPGARVEALGRFITRTGENVARANGVARAHRALFRSPSHRANVLDPHFDAIGIGIASDSDGVVWVCEVFARFAR